MHRDQRLDRRGYDHAPPGGARLALKGYAPFVAVCVALALLLAAVPTKDIKVAAGSGDPANPSPIWTGVAPPGVEAASTCEGGTRQTKEPYSPPCLVWKGTDNGGATWNGVTSDTITITFRTGNLPDLFAAVGGIAQKVGVKDTQADVERTARAYIAYFNEKFELYGRKVELKMYKGVGDQLSEFFGGAPEGAQADAITAAQQVHSFADMSALSTPYAEALTRQRVIAMPPVHMSREWYEEHTPYAWGVLVDCNRLVETLVDWAVKRVLPYRARYAGDPTLRSKQRRFAIVTPEQPWYKTCADAGITKLKSLGFAPEEAIFYPLDFNRLSTDAVSIVSKLKSRGVTSVACACDPILPLFMTGSATQQKYFPEWILASTALTDVDAVGQIYDAAQWNHTFGLSFLSDIYHGSEAESYRVYKTIRSDEPAFIGDVFYYPILMLFLGIHMAGPNLTPETFQQGLYNYPPTVGEAGKWSFGPGDHTATDDAREVYFNQTAISPFNASRGGYVQVLQGRFEGATWPEKEATFPIDPDADAVPTEINQQISELGDDLPLPDR